MSEQVVQTAPAAPSAQPAQAPASAQAPQSPPSQQTNANEPQGRYIQVPADQLSEFGGRFGEALSAARQYRRATDEGLFELAQVMTEQGYDIRQTIQHLRSQGASASQAQAAAQQAQPGEGDGSQPPASLTAEQIEAILDKREQAAEERRQKAQAESSRVEARQREDAAIFKTLNDLGFKAPAAGQKDPRFRMALASMDAFLYEEKMADFQDYAAWSDSLRKLKLDQHMSAAATPEQVERAKLAFTAALKDSGNEAIAAFAQGQQQIPSASLAGGPGGSAPAKSMSQLTPKEKRAEYERRLALKQQGR